MKPHLLFFFICVVALFLSCGGREERSARAAAEKVISAMTPERLNTFLRWSYSQRGDFWYKDSAGQVNCSSRFVQRNDSVIITVMRPVSFIKEFQLDIPLDNRLYGLTLIRSVDTCFFISEDSLIGPYRWTTLDCSTDTVFRQNNPFSFFQDLTQFKDAMNINAIGHMGASGNIIQIYLPGWYVLTYLPEGSTTGLNKVWQEEFAQGEMIDKNWNLRKLTKQEEGR